MHAVATAVGLKYTSHRRRRRVGEYGVNEKALSSIRLQRCTRTDCAQFHLFGTRQFPGPHLFTSRPGTVACDLSSNSTRGTPFCRACLILGRTPSSCVSQVFIWTE